MVKVAAAEGSLAEERVTERAVEVVRQRLSSESSFVCGPLGSGLLKEHCGCGGSRSARWAAMREWWVMMVSCATSVGSKVWVPG